MAKTEKSINEKCKNYIQKYTKQNKAILELIEKIKGKNTTEVKVIKKQFIDDIEKKSE